jgi:hypothetical protein
VIAEMKFSFAATVYAWEIRDHAAVYNARMLKNVAKLIADMAKAAMACRENIVFGMGYDNDALIQVAKISQIMAVVVFPFVNVGKKAMRIF